LYIRTTYTMICINLPHYRGKLATMAT